jgi:hypothetical protein
MPYFDTHPRYLPGGSEEITKNFETHSYNLGWDPNLGLFKCEAISISVYLEFWREILRNSASHNMGIH